MFNKICYKEKLCRFLNSVLDKYLYFIEKCFIDLLYNECVELFYNLLVINVR